ncbi:MAG TPA: CAP domain-containing protein [Candidatus Paceibacterota bacterium]|nr:CAP domain-containing protein [Candidatus Paceibacterota bacterium]
MIRRGIWNAIIVLFVAMSLFFLWPTIKAFSPKAGTLLKQFPGKVSEILKKSFGIGTVRWDDTEEREVKGERDTLPTYEDSSITGIGVATETNRERAAAGLPVLRYNTQLAASAKLKVDDMIAFQYFEHKSPAGVSVSNLGDTVGYTYITIGENLAMGDFTSDADVVAAWMKSPGHKANILSTKYKEIGVAARKAEYHGKVVWFVVQHFGTNRASCPSVDTAAKSAIDALRKQTDALEEKIVTAKHELEQPDAPLEPGYNEAVNAYNNMVDDYNALVQKTKTKVTSYNTQVRTFNQCLARYQ